MKFLSVFLVTIFLIGCATNPQPTAVKSTPAPAAATTVSAPPTSAPGRTPLAPLSIASIDITGVSQTTQSNQVNTTANITTGQNLGVGQIELSYPQTMIVGESRNVSLRLSAASQLASTTKVPAKTPLPNAGFVYQFSGNVNLYPIMNAQLIAGGFDVKPNDAVQHVVDTATPAQWTWVITAKEAGRQELALSISIPAVVDGVGSNLTKTLQDLSIGITVQPKPVSFTEQIAQSIANNSGAIIVALIGLIGTIIGIVVKMRAEKFDSAKPQGK